MNLDQLINKLTALQNSIQLDILNTIEVMLNDSKALINRRVENEGKDADDSFFSDYSDGYASRRKEKGLQVKHKDFSFSREMWKSIGITFKSNQNGKLILILEPTDKINKEKMLKLEGQEGKAILELSENELDKIVMAVENKIVRLFNEL